MRQRLSLKTRCLVGVAGVHTGAEIRRIAVLFRNLTVGIHKFRCIAEKVNADKKKLTENPRIVWGIRGLILAVGVLFIVLGIFNGGMADVLGKAIRICTECIGLG